MNLPPIDLTNEDGATVVSIEVLRRQRYATSGRCRHGRVQTDEEAAELLCRDCGLRLNPVSWIAGLAESWREVSRLWDGYRAERERLEQRQRVRCRACGETVVLRSSSDDERRRRESRTGRYEDALRRISVLVPGAASEHAARIARETLAARPAAEAPPPAPALLVPVPDPRGGKA